MTRTHHKVPFRTTYAQLHPRFEGLENMRLRHNLRAKIAQVTAITGIFIMIIPVISIFAYWWFIAANFIPIFCGGMLMLIAGYGEILRLRDAYQKEYKSSIIPVLLRNFETKLSYRQKGYIPKINFLHSRFFHPDLVANYNGSDLIRGKKGKTVFQMCHVNTFHQERRRAKTIFNGLFLEADFHKHFRGFTIILPVSNVLERKSEAKRFRKMGLEEVKLEHPRFNEKYVVLSNDQVTARYILSPSFISHFMKVQRKFGCPVYASFLQGRMFLGANMDMDLFAPDPKTVADNRYMLQDLYEDLHSCIGLIDDLNLNTRIWSKQTY